MKKKIVIYFLVVICLSLIFVFSNAAYIVEGDSIKDDNRLLYMYRSNYLEDEQNQAVLITSYMELRNYYSQNNDKYDLDADNEDAKYYELKSFRDTVLNGYSDAWFKEKNLILLVTYELSDEYYYRLNSLDYWFTKAKVCLYRDTPNENAQNTKICWHTFLETDKKSFVFSATVSVVDK